MGPGTNLPTTRETRVIQSYNHTVVRSRREVAPSATENPIVIYLLTSPQTIIHIIQEDFGGMGTEWGDKGGGVAYRGQRGMYG